MAQCHNCPKSVTNGGTPDEECFTCKGAEYLSNGFKTVTPVDDVSKLQSKQDPTFGKDSGLEKNGDLIEYGKGKTKRNLEDCEKVLGVLKDCHHTSFKHIACMVALFISMGMHAPLLTNMLNGGSFADYARIENTTKQNVSQVWKRLVERNPIIANISKRKRKKITI